MQNNTIVNNSIQAMCSYIVLKCQLQGCRERVSKPDWNQ